ncbi:MAG: hypothetical protein K0S81_2274 [Rhodospirillales bacterium]|jgi:hypothetical protein|nr:hypothetical protein [Rhodospirillales bacterium]
MLSAIANLRLVAKCCREGQRLEGDLANWLGQGLETFLNHRARSLHEALGLRVPKGGVPWWREEAIRQRDAALRQLASLYLCGLSASGKAREIERLARRYAATAWRFDRTREDMPREYSGKAQQWIWIAFKSGAPMPLGQRQLRQILGK